MKKIAVFGAMLGLYAPFLGAQPPTVTPEMQELAKAAKKTLDSTALRADLRSAIGKHIGPNLSAEQKKLAQELVDLTQEFVQFDQAKLQEESEKWVELVRQAEEKKDLAAIPKGPEMLKLERWEERSEKLNQFLTAFFEGNLPDRNQRIAYIFEWLGVLADGVEQGLGDKPE